MDGLSAAASVIAVVSLAFRLAESAKKLCDFWDSIQNAPEEINDIKSELESLRDILEQIGHDAEHQPPSPSTLSALKMCSGKINIITSLTADIESGLTSSRIRTRKWSALRAAFKREKIEKVQNSLNRLKATLILLVLNNNGRSSRLQDEQYNHDIQALTRQISDLRFHSITGQVTGASSRSIDSHSHILARTQVANRFSNLKSNDLLAFGFKNDAQAAPTCPSRSTGLFQSKRSSLSRTDLSFRHAVRHNDKVVDTFFGTFRLSSRTSLLFPKQSEDPTGSEEEDRFEHENNFRLIPSSWLAWFGFTSGLSARITQSPLSGPKIVLDVVRSVPDNAVIFDLCRKGNFDCVQALLNRGQASAKDVDSQGRTPLYFAAESCHVELCKLLIRCGADRDARNYDDADVVYYNIRNPLYAIAYNHSSESETPYHPDRVIDTLRLFIDLVDVLHLEGDRWTSGSEIIRIISEYHQHEADEGVTGDVFIWTLEMLGPDFWESFEEDFLQSSMLWCLSYGQEQRMQRLLQLCNNVVDARDTVGGYSLLHQAAADVEDYLIPLLTIGATANLVGFNPEHSPYDETPISISMYRADTFVTLQRALKITTPNFETTFNQALEDRWTKEALVELFSEDLDLSPILRPQLLVCPYCLQERRIMVQPYWMRILWSIMFRARSQSIRNVVRMMLSRDSLAAAVSRDDYEDEETNQHIHMHNQNTEDSDIVDEHLSDHEDKSIPFQTDDESVRECNIRHVSVDDNDMCLLCWVKWGETGLKPSPDESKCLGCNQSLSSPECRGRCHNSGLYCVYCAAKLAQAEYAMKRKHKKCPPPVIIDSDEEEQDHYSPYLIHT